VGASGCYVAMAIDPAEKMSNKAEVSLSYSLLIYNTLAVRFCLSLR
jgi:hypothetical protein